MHTRSVLSGILMALLIQPAFAADWGKDFYDDPFAFKPAIHDFSGGYAGIHGGWNWSRYKLNGRVLGEHVTGSSKPDGIVAGLHSGYGIQTDQLYYGLEADVDYMDREIGDNWAKLTNNWQGSLRGRLGWVVDDVMLYATGGVAVTQFKLAFDGASDRDTRFGWTAGAGAEALLDGGWRARAEYLYTDYRKSYADPALATDLSLNLNTHVVRVGLSYNFGE